MLHDAARKGDVEIPVFCYEPKLGEPVGACRMCLVEIEGIPKLQTSCSTPVRDGMVVHTRTEQVKHAQSAVVEFLLVNHPLDCPVCDKGGECPLQDITQGWGPGKSRVIDEKRHFQKPIELSPLVAIDRERCILCYRCVRFSQEVSEDAQLQLLERGDRTFVGTFDDRPYVAPVPRQHHRHLPGRGADQLHLPLPRPALGHRAGRLGLHALPEPVQRQLHRPRREGETGDRPRQPRGRRRLALRPRPLRLRDVRRRGAGRRAAAAKAAAATDWETAIAAAADGPAARPTARSRRSSATPPTRRASWSSGCCARRSAPPHVDSRPSARRRRASAIVRLAQPELSAKVRDIDEADVILVLGTDPLHSSPILDLRVRKAIRRNGAKPGGRDRAADRARRRRRGDRPLRPRRGRPLRLRAGRAPSAAPRTSRRRWPRACADAEQGRRHLGRAHRPATAPPTRCSASPTRSASPAPRAPACSKSPTPPTPAACARPAASPTPARASSRERLCRSSGKRISTEGDRGDPRRAGVAASSTALILFGVDPLRDFPDTTAWEAALTAADFVVCLLDARERDHAPRPTSSSRSRPTPRKTAPSPTPTAACSASAPRRPPRRHPPRTSSVLSRALPLPSATTPASTPSPPPSPPSPTPSPSTPSSTDADIGGRGIRWQDTAAAAAVPAAGRAVGTDSADALARRASGESAPTALPDSDRSGSELALGTYRDLWAGPITELNPPLKFLQPARSASRSRRATPSASA